MNKATNNMLRQGLLAMLVMLVSAGSALAQQSLFFSEYIEGGGDNKAFEIYNPTDAAIDLGNYIVLGNYNGNPFNDTLRFPMGTMLESMDVFVVAHANAEHWKKKWHHGYDPFTTYYIISLPQKKLLRYWKTK